jgi:single stranded DNA-binding protein
MLNFFGHVTLVSDPELKTVGTNSVEVVTLRVVSNEYRKDKEGNTIQDAHFFDAKAWDSGAATIAKLAHKGDSMVVSGKIRQETWVDKTTNEKRSKTILRIEQFTILYKNKKDVEPSDGPVV